MYGVLGLSKYKISVQGIDQLTKAAEIVVNFKLEFIFYFIHG